MKNELAQVIISYYSCFKILDIRRNKKKEETQNPDKGKNNKNQQEVKGQAQLNKKQMIDDLEKIYSNGKQPPGKAKQKIEEDKKLELQKQREKDKIKEKENQFYEIMFNEDIDSDEELRKVNYYYYFLFNII